MEEPSTIIEVPSDLVAGMKNDCSGISNCACGKENSFASMPICFLVKEHAKSLVAIQELQKRMENVEATQDDVVDAIIDINGYLKSNQKNSISINSSVPLRSPFSALTKINSTKPRRFSYSLSPFKEAQDVPSVMPKRRSLSLRDLTRELRKEVPSVISDQVDAQKLLELAKTKESALESDKQDSGLDSDCRDQVDAQASVNKHWPQQESGDELLHLLDEIGHKSETLQRQLSSVDENSVLNNLKEEMSQLQNDTQGLQSYLCDIKGERDLLKSKLDFLETSSKELTCERKELQRKLSTLVENRSFVGVTDDGMHNAFAKRNFNACAQLLEHKPISAINVQKIKRNATFKIDSALVSTVLKESNVVELQRQVLLYLAENALLHGKLGEMEQLMLRKNQNANIETGKCDEVRTLMIENRELHLENRELRISMDEQKFESNDLKSKIATMERVLHSVTVENRELNWQLEETLGQGSINRHNKHELATSFTFGSSTAKSTKGRRTSLPPRFGVSQEATITCNKTKLLPNTSSFLDVTIEEDEHLPGQPGEASNFTHHARPLITSTPAGLPLQKQKELRFSTLVDTSPVLPNPSGNTIVSHYHTIRKRLKSGDKNNGSNKEQCVSEKESRCNNSPSCSFKGLKLSEKKLPLESTNPFPFNTILEKLKANSEYRMSKNISMGERCETSGSSGGQRDLVNCVRSNSVVVCDSDPVCQHGLNSQEISSQGRKSFGNTRNLHQRIQDILDRITAESEEAGT